MLVKRKKIFVFGNPDLEMDSLPLRILPRLQREFPEIGFEIVDPNEDWAIPKDQIFGEDAGLIVLDTALGIEDVTVFDDLEKFKAAPRVSMHDFDALANLRLLQKLGKIKKAKVIGVPPDIKEAEALSKVIGILKRF